MTASDPFSGMAAFITAAESHSFTGAGRKLGQTPSAVSKAIGRLEQELGVKLFLRSPRNLALTNEGELYYQQCKDLLSTATDARALVTGQNARGAGHLRVCLPISFAQQLIAPALVEWRRQNPETSIEVILSDRQVDLVSERFDLAIYFHKVPDSRLIAKALPAPTFITAASPEYLLQRGEPKTIAELNQHTCLTYIDPQTNQLRPWRFGGAKVDGTNISTFIPSSSVSSDQGSFLLNHALKNGGILQAPYYLLADALSSGQLRAVLIDTELPGPNWWLVYPQRRQQSLKLQHFIEFLMRQLKTTNDLPDS